MKEKNDKKDFLGGTCSSFSKNNSKSGTKNADIDMASISQNIQIQISKFSDSEKNSNAMLNQETAKVNL